MNRSNMYMYLLHPEARIKYNKKKVSQIEMESPPLNPNCPFLFLFIFPFSGFSCCLNFNIKIMETNTMKF